jgi:hypothetical protein
MKSRADEERKENRDKKIDEKENEIKEPGELRPGNHQDVQGEHENEKIECRVPEAEHHVRLTRMTEWFIFR